MSALLNQLQIASPCPAKWEDMTGDDKVRFCSQCQKNVYNISKMTSVEAESLIKEKEGNLCARIFKRIDGTVLTQDCPVGVEKIRARARVMRQAVATFLVGVAGFLMGLVVPQKWKQPLEDALVQKMVIPFEECESRGVHVSGLMMPAQSDTQIQPPVIQISTNQFGIPTRQFVDP
jgi:hypothetical protein